MTGFLGDLFLLEYVNYIYKYVTLKFEGFSPRTCQRILGPHAFANLAGWKCHRAQRFAVAWQGENKPGQVVLTIGDLCYQYELVQYFATIHTL